MYCTSGLFGPGWNSGASGIFLSGIGSSSVSRNFFSSSWSSFFF